MTYINSATPLLHRAQNQQIDHIRQSVTESVQETKPFFQVADIAIFTHFAVTTTAALLLLLKDDKAAGTVTLGMSVLTAKIATKLIEKENKETTQLYIDINNNHSTGDINDDLIIDMEDIA